MRIDKNFSKTTLFSPGSSTSRIRQGGVNISQSATKSKLLAPKETCFSQVLHWLSFPLKLPFMFLFSFGQGLGLAIKKQTLVRDFQAVLPERAPKFVQTLVMNFCVPFITVVHLINWVLSAFAHVFNLNLRSKNIHFGLKTLWAVFFPIILLNLLVIGSIMAIKNAFKTREGELKNLLSGSNFPQDKQKLAELLIEVDTYPMSSGLHAKVGTLLKEFPHTTNRAFEIRREIYAFINTFYSPDSKAFWSLTKFFPEDYTEMLHLALKVPPSMREWAGAFSHYQSFLEAVIQQEKVQIARDLLPFMPDDYLLLPAAFEELRQLFGLVGLADYLPRAVQIRTLRRWIEANQADAVNTLTRPPFKLPFDYSALKSTSHILIITIARDRLLERKDFNTPQYASDLAMLLDVCPNDHVLFFGREILDTIIKSVEAKDFTDGLIRPFVQTQVLHVRSTFMNKMLEAGVSEDKIRETAPAVTSQFYDQVIRNRYLTLFKFVEKQLPNTVVHHRQVLTGWLEEASDTEWSELEKITGGFIQEMVDAAFFFKRNKAAKRLVESHGLKPDFTEVQNRELAVICCDWLLKHKNRTHELSLFLANGFSHLTSKQQLPFVTEMLPEKLTAQSLKPFFQPEVGEACSMAAYAIFSASLSDSEKIALLKAVLTKEAFRSISRIEMGRAALSARLVTELRLLATAMPSEPFDPADMTTRLPFEQIIQLKQKFPQQVDLSAQPFQEYVLGIEEESQVKTLVFEAGLIPSSKTAVSLGQKFPKLVTELLEKFRDRIAEDDQERLSSVLSSHRMVDEIETVIKEGFPLSSQALRLYTRERNFKNFLVLSSHPHSSDKARGRLFLGLLNDRLVKEAMEFFETFRPGSSHGGLSFKPDATASMAVLWRKNEAFFLMLLRIFPQLCLSRDSLSSPLAEQLIAGRRLDLLEKLLPLEPKMKTFGRPVHMAVQTSNWRALELLCKNSATGEWDKELVLQKDDIGHTPFHVALFSEKGYPLLAIAFKLFEVAPSIEIPPEFREDFKKIISTDSGRQFVNAMLETHFCEALSLCDEVSQENLFEGLKEYIEKEKNPRKQLLALQKVFQLLAKKSHGEKVELTAKQQKDFNIYFLKILRGFLGHRPFIEMALESIKQMYQLLTENGSENLMLNYLFLLLDLLTDVFEFPKKDIAPCQYFIQRLDALTRNAKALEGFPRDLVTGFGRDSKVLLSLDDSQKRELTKYFLRVQDLIETFTGKKGYLETVEERVEQVRKEDEKFPADTLKKLQAIIDELSELNPDQGAPFEIPRFEKSYFNALIRVRRALAKAGSMYQALDKTLNPEKVPGFEKLDKAYDTAFSGELMMQWGFDEAFTNEHLETIKYSGADLRKLGLTDSVRLAVEADDDPMLLEMVKERVDELSPHFKGSVPFGGKLSTGIKKDLVDAEKKANMAKLKRLLDLK